MDGTDQSQYLVSYKTLRSIIGAVGILLFLVPLIYGAVKGNLPESISRSYYTSLRDFFVGALCVLGMFLVSYRGYDLLDTVITDIAGVCVVVIAFCPTSSPNPKVAQTVSNHIHPIAASIAFVLLAVMALQFTQVEQTDMGWRAVLKRLGKAAIYQFPKARNAGRNYAYVTCAWIIVASIILAAISVIPLFWPEAFMLAAFGISWTIKGEPVARARAALKPPAPEARPEAATV